MRRRMIGLVLLGVGAFCVVAALAVRFVLAPQLVVLPLAQDASSVATGTATVFYPGDLTQRSGVAVRAGRDVIGDPKAPGAGPDVAVWTGSLQVTDPSGALVAVSEDRVCMNRHTAEDVACVSERVDGDNRVKHTGLSYTFPFGVQQQDYDMFDITAKKAFPARFSGVEEIDGTQVYKFVQTVPETVTEQMEVPGSIAGGAAGTDVIADRLYSNVRTVWVEPTSGVIVNGQEQVRQAFRGPDGAQGVTLLQGTLAFDAKTIAAGLDRAREAKGQITALTVTGPVVLGVVGLLALVGGGLLVRSGRRRDPVAHRSERRAPLHAQPGS
jgi:Porin PorA